VNPVAHTAAIGFQFCFAGAAAADTSRQARERRVLSHHQSRQHIFQLGQLDLNLSFMRLGPLRKDVEDKLRSVDYL
jgi:hypothetical protein